MGKTDYSTRTHITVSVPRELVEEVKKLIKSTDYKGGYRNHTEFCDDAIRRRIEYIQEKIIQQKSRKDHEEIVDK